MTARHAVILLIAPLVALLAACTKQPQDYLADDARRSATIETLVGDVSMRQEVIQRLMSGGPDRTAVFKAILQDEEAAGVLIQYLMADDRGKALVAGNIAADADVARSFMRMLMLTGVVGELITQQQADRLDLGLAYAHGNQQRTMTDLKTLGQVIDRWAGEHAGRYPVCPRYGAVGDCLATRLPADTVASLRLQDAWGLPFQYISDADGKRYTLASHATDGQFDGRGNAGPTASYDCDIVFSNGEFIQWPGRIHRKSIRASIQ